MKLLISLCAFFPFAASAATIWSNTWNVSTAIPDNDDVGYTNSQIVADAGLVEIQNVTVNLNFTGGWNGDLYVYLMHGSGFAVLLNRPGRSVSSPDGSGTVGLDVTLDDNAPADIHTAIPDSGGTFSGTYQSDGRNVDPYNVVSTDPRTATLASFFGTNANGTWTLFVADQAAGDSSTLNSWSLTITAVPEPSAALLGGLGILVLLWRRRH